MSSSSTWRVSRRGDQTDPQTLDFCLRQLRAEYKGEDYPEGVETLCDVRVVADSKIEDLSAADAAQIVVPWTRGEPGEGSQRGECHWVVPQQATINTSRRILYCIGGGYTGCRPKDYHGMVSRIATATGLPCFIFDYRKAPEHPFPLAIDDAFNAFLWVVHNGPDSHKESAQEVVLMGDSAGGGLALAIALRLHRLKSTIESADSDSFALPSDASFRSKLEQVQLPRLRLVTISAYTDLSCSTQSYKTRTWSDETMAGDPCFSSGDQATDVKTSLEWAQQYGCSQEKHPECSPYYASASALASFPSTLMIVGDQELMLSETTDLAKRAADAGANVSLTVYPGMWHVFPMYTEACAKSPAGVVVEAEDALQEIASFLADEEPPAEVITEVRARAEKDPPIAMSGACLCGSVRRRISTDLPSSFSLTCLARAQPHCPS